MMANGKVGRPKGLTRKKIIGDTIKQLIADGYFSEYRKSSEVSHLINEKLPNHWTTIGSKGTGHHLKRYKQLDFKEDSTRVKSWIIKDNDEGGE